MLVTEAVRPADTVVGSEKIDVIDLYVRHNGINLENFIFEIVP